MGVEIIDVHGHAPLDRSLIPKVIESLRVNGVRMLFVSSVGRASWPEFPSDDQVEEANEDTFDLCREHDDRLRGYVYLNPNGKWESELDKWRRNRFFIGVKLWISLKDAQGRSDICLPILNCAAEGSFPVLVHGFFRHGGNRPGELDPAEIASLGKKVPQARIIMAHMGFAWEKGVKAVADQGNVYPDVSGGPPLRGSVEHAVKSCGAERILFGSDVPCRTIQSQLHKVRAAGISSQDKARILDDNARALFRYVLK